jgi:catechol 2,3-dioxygenase-like lactoylglutathione lyase family enzyme
MLPLKGVIHMIRHKTLAVGITSFALGVSITVMLAQTPVTITRFQGELAHVAIVVRDLDKTAKNFADVFGVTLPEARIIKNISMPPDFGPGATVAGRFLNFSASGVNFELVQPLEGGADPWNDVLGQKDAVVHHIAFRVPDVPQLQATTAFLQAKGGKWTEGSTTTVYSYVDMRPQLGFVIEAIAAKGLPSPQAK